MSLRARLLAGMAVVALVLIGVAVVITRTAESYLLDQIDSQLEFAGGPRAFINAPPPNENREPENFSSIYLARVDASGELIVMAKPQLTGTNPPLPQVDASTAEQMAESGEPYTVDSDIPGQRYRLRSRVDSLSGDVIVVGVPISNVDDAVSRLVWVELVATLAVLAVLSLVTWWVIHLGVRPIKRMTATAQQIAEGDLSHRVPTAAPGTEAGELGVALNQMLGRIETAFDEQAQSETRLRRFIADASHELRTPVTTIRGYGELYRMGGLAQQEQLDEAMRRTEQEATRMGNLVSDMLQLARLDQGRELHLLPVRLDLLAADAAADARAVQPDRQLSVSLEAMSVLGDEERLRQVLANLVGNALVHTPVDAPIEIDVRTDPSQVDQVLLTVTDHGPGMAPDAMAQAFERFYRADPSRSRQHGGSGLGLAIVESIVEAHHGRVEMTSDLGVGTVVTVRLPTEPPVDGALGAAPGTASEQPPPAPPTTSA